MERLKIAERTRRGVRARVDGGRPIPGQKAPFGYRWRDEDKSGYVLDPETAPVVRRIFEAALRGETFRSIATALTASGTPTPTGRGRRWEVSSLHGILTNPVYAGRPAAYRTRQERRKGKVRVLARPAGQWVPLPAGTAPAILTEAEFEAVQARLERNKATAPRNNADPEATLLRCGIARCGYCGYPLSITKRAGRAHLYRCHPVGRERHGCPSFGVMAPILDEAVWRRVEAVLTRPAIIASEVARRAQADVHAADLAALDRRRAGVASRRGRLARAVATLEDEEAAAPLLADLRKLAAEAKVLTEERASLEARVASGAADQRRLADLAAWCGRVAGNLPTLTYQQKRMALEALGVLVKVYRADHDPRWEITMTPVPIEDMGEDPFVFGTGMGSSTGTSRPTPRASTG
jgi:site-specific DNA recombinase